MSYIFFKQLIADIQAGTLDPKTLLISVDWKEDRLEVSNREEVIWHGFARNVLLECIHVCLGILTIDDMRLALFNEELETTTQNHKEIWQGITSMSKEEIFDRLYQAAEKQSQTFHERGNTTTGQ